MKIPNDLGGNWRLNKFVEYQHNAPAIDPLTLVEFAKRRKLNVDDCIVLAWYHSLTYCEVTAAFLFERLNYSQLQLAEVETFWKENKPNLIFGSARKYVKNMDWFVPLMEKAIEEIFPSPYVWLDHIANDRCTPKYRYKNIEKYLGKWKFMGRFSIDLFTEALIAMSRAGLIPLKLESSGYDWSKTSNLTSGMFNIFYHDDLADKFDKGELPIGMDTTFLLDKYLWKVLTAVEKAYPDQEIDRVSVVNKICSFRNLFKKARYGGFHHDRQLGNLIEYNKNYPANYELWSLLYEIRSDIFPRHMLGERCYDNGIGYWFGIRKERKKLWVEKGLTGVESASKHKGL